jgi:hypothetical protein
MGVHVDDRSCREIGKIGKPGAHPPTPLLLLCAKHTATSVGIGRKPANGPQDIQTETLPPAAAH